MTLLIRPLIDRSIPYGRLWNPAAFEHILIASRRASLRKNNQAIKLCDKKTVHSEIESVRNNFGTPDLFYPVISNTGGRRALAKIESELAIDIETTLLARRN